MRNVFRTARKNIWNRSERKQAKIPNDAERFRTAPACTEEHEGFTITIREAARIFEDAGVPEQNAPSPSGAT